MSEEEECICECPKCDCAVKRCDFAWRANDEDNINIGYYLDICRKCDEEEDDDDCICESDKNPNPLCPDHQCCWTCSTQSVPIGLNEHSRLWLCDGCNDKGDWCRGCRNLIDEDTGFCSVGCDYGEWCGSWKCNRCDTWREDEKHCANCGPDPADV